MTTPSKNSPPNIFNYATSELTQDAFIAWLLEWANPAHAGLNVQLHELGTAFLQSFLAKQNIELGAISEWKIQTQFQKIDVLVSFEMHGKKHAIIIEDKVHSQEHSKQLERYKQTINNLKIADIIVPIYFKTGYQVNRKRIAEKEYLYYTIKDFVGVLSAAKVAEIDHDVLTQYHQYLLQQEGHYDWADTEANNYLVKPLQDWTWWTCVRFFHKYKETFNASWGSVGNNREPLVAFWFGGRTFMYKSTKLEIYMDIQYTRKKLHVNYRLGLFNEPMQNDGIRNEVFEAFRHYLKAKNIEAKKPKFTRAKKTILLARVDKLDRTMHYADFVKQLEEYQGALNAFHNGLDGLEGWSKC